MGRKPTKNLSLPVRMRARKQKSGRVFYYYDTGATPRREVPLGSDYLLAVKKWADLRGTETAPAALFAEAVERYKLAELPAKAEKTQHEYKLAFKRLLVFFDGAPLDEITPQHLYQYEQRHAAHPVQAARDKAAFSVVFEHARKMGYTTATNPAAGVRFKGTKARRTNYVSDAALAAVYAAATPELQDALDIAYAIGQRPQDVLPLGESDVQDGVLVVEQRKVKSRGGKTVKFTVEGRLQAAIERCRRRKSGMKVWTMLFLTNEHGRPLTANMLRNRFDAARLAAAGKHPELAEQIKRFQFRDLRAKAGTDRAEAEGEKAAQDMLGHQDIRTTSIYVRSRGVKVRPNR